MFLNKGMMCINVRRSMQTELETCEMVDATSIMRWNPHHLTDDTDIMEASECEELNSIASERKNSIQKTKCLKKPWKQQHNMEPSIGSFPCKGITRAGIPFCRGEESMKIYGSPLLQALKAAMEVKDSLESTQNTYHTVDFKLNHKELIVCLISLGKKLFQSPFSETVQERKHAQYGLNAAMHVGNEMGLPQYTFTLVGTKQTLGLVKAIGTGDAKQCCLRQDSVTQRAHHEPHWCGVLTHGNEKGACHNWQSTLGGQKQALKPKSTEMPKMCFCKMILSLRGCRMRVIGFLIAQNARGASKLAANSLNPLTCNWYCQLPQCHWQWCEHRTWNLTPKQMRIQPPLWTQMPGRAQTPRGSTKKESKQNWHSLLLSSSSSTSHFLCATPLLNVQQTPFKWMTNKMACSVVFFRMVGSFHILHTPLAQPCCRIVYDVQSVTNEYPFAVTGSRCPINVWSFRPNTT